MCYTDFSGGKERLFKISLVRLIFEKVYDIINYRCF